MQQPLFVSAKSQLEERQFFRQLNKRFSHICFLVFSPALAALQLAYPLRHRAHRTEHAPAAWFVKEHYDKTDDRHRGAERPALSRAESGGEHAGHKHDQRERSLFVAPDKIAESPIFHRETLIPNDKRKTAGILNDI